ncbi:MAG: chromate resistance protein ChrB domain-containing protein, partial [Myxococcota bacterium]
YAPIADEALALGEHAELVPAEVARLRRRLDEVRAIDFFEAPARRPTEGLVAALEARLRPAPSPASRRDEWTGRTWVTRRGIKVDRMASAWLIRRFIDPEARFKFVEGKDHVPLVGEVRFDMFAAEFTHEGDLCTFEVLARRFVPEDAGVAALAEIVHDIDLKDGKFGRVEAAGVAMLVDAIAGAHPGDEERLARASAVLDDLYALAARSPARG